MNRKHLAASLWRAVRATADSRWSRVSQPHLCVSHVATSPGTPHGDVFRGSSPRWVHTGTSCERSEPATLPSKLVQFPLAQTGEGIKECELIQWFVKVPALVYSLEVTHTPQVGDSVEMFDKVCEVQSDKAAVEITSRYAGTITHLHHAVGDLVQVGEPLVDIELQGEGMEVVEAVPSPPPVRHKERRERARKERNIPVRTLRCSSTPPQWHSPATPTAPVLPPWPLLPCVRWPGSTVLTCPR